MIDIVIEIWLFIVVYNIQERQVRDILAIAILHLVLIGTVNVKAISGR